MCGIQKLLLQRHFLLACLSKMPHNRLAPAVWGPHGWGFIHAACFAYPETPRGEQRRAMYNFLLAIGQVLPCKECAAEWAAMLRQTLRSTRSEHLASRDALARWSVARHNDVNERLGKPVVDFAVVALDYSVTAPRCPLVSLKTGSAVHPHPSITGIVVSASVSAIVASLLIIGIANHARRNKRRE